jgi:ubiquitin-activating enzyme E1 C
LLGTALGSNSHLLFSQASARAAEFGISGVTYRLTQGVVKRIIPNVASTSAVIAAACANEAFKLASRLEAEPRGKPRLPRRVWLLLISTCNPLLQNSCCPYLNNYMVFNDVDGVYSYSFEYERKPDCLACSSKPRVVSTRPEQALTTLVTSLVDRSVRKGCMKRGGHGGWCCWFSSCEAFLGVA